MASLDLERLLLEPHPPALACQQRVGVARLGRHRAPCRGTRSGTHSHTRNGSRPRHHGYGRGVPSARKRACGERSAPVSTRDPAHHARLVGRVNTSLHSGHQHISHNPPHTLYLLRSTPVLRTCSVVQARNQRVQGSTRSSEPPPRQLGILKAARPHFRQKLKSMIHLATVTTSRTRALCRPSSRSSCTPCRSPSAR